MFNTIAVGTDGSDTADKAVEMALDIADHYQARLLVFSVYKPVGGARLDHEREDAPEDIQWAINPPRGCGCDAGRRQAASDRAGLGDDDRCPRGRARGHDLRARRRAPGRPAGDRQQGDAAASVRQRAKKISQNAPCSVVIAKTT